MLFVPAQETFGAMAKTEKIAFILEQVLLLQYCATIATLHICSVNMCWRYIALVVVVRASSKPAVGQGTFLGDALSELVFC